MPEIKVWRSPWESAQALVADHALEKYNITDADPLKVVTDMVFMESKAVIAEDGTVSYIGPTPELRLAAAKTLLQYTRPQVKAVHMHIDAEVNVQHSTTAADATEKAKRLLALLSGRKYASGETQKEALEAEFTAVPPETVQH